MKSNSLTKLKTTFHRLALVYTLVYPFHRLLYPSPADCTVPLVLQCFWDRALVPCACHATPHPYGVDAGREDSQVPLVRRPLLGSVLPAPAVAGLRPVAGRMAGDGGRWGTLPRGHALHHPSEPAPGPQPQPLA